MKKTLTVIAATVCIAIFSLAQTVPQPAVKRYVALLSQSGADAPTAVVLENSLGEVELRRIDAGTYRLSLTNGFPAGHVFYSIPTSEEGIDNSRIYISDVESDRIILTTTNNTGGGLDDVLGCCNGQGTPIEIRVY